MTNPLVQSFSNQLDDLAQYMEEHYDYRSPDSGFAEYIFRCTASQIPFKVLSDPETESISIEKLSQGQAPSLDISKN